MPLSLSLLSSISPRSSSPPAYFHTPTSVSLSARSLLPPSVRRGRCFLNFSRRHCLPPAAHEEEVEEDELLEIEGSDVEDDEEESLDVDALEREAKQAVREFSESLSRQLRTGLLHSFHFFSCGSFVLSFRDDALLHT